MKKILFIETPEYTGASRMTHIIANTLKDKYDESFAMVVPNDVQVIKNCIEEENPDILFCSFSVLNADVIVEGKARGLKVVVRSDYRPCDIQSKILYKLRKTYPDADKIIAQSEELRAELIAEFSLPQDKVVVVENTIDKDVIESSLRNAVNPYPDNGCKHLLWVGRFEPIKDIPTLMKSFEIVHKQNKNTELYLVGKPKDTDKYHQEGVILVGFQNNPYPWIKYADCLVLTSKSEANSNVIREALYLNVPVISTCCCNYSDDQLKVINLAKVGDASGIAQKIMHIISGYK